jgi:hypothetical protein
MRRERLQTSDPSLLHIIISEEKSRNLKSAVKVLLPDTPGFCNDTRIL